MDCVIEASIDYLQETKTQKIDYKQHRPKEALTTRAGRVSQSPGANSRKDKIFVTPVVSELSIGGVITKDFITLEFAKVFVLARFLPRKIGDHDTNLDLLNLYRCFEEYVFHTEKLWIFDLKSERHQPGEGEMHQPNVLFQQFCLGIPNLIGKFFEFSLIRGGTCSVCETPKFADDEIGLYCHDLLFSKKKEEKGKIEEKGKKEEKKKSAEAVSFTFLLSALQEDKDELACDQSGCSGKVLRLQQFQFHGGYAVFHMPVDSSRIGST
jgi:hypothetical protein